MSKKLDLTVMSAEQAATMDAHAEAIRAHDAGLVTAAERINSYDRSCRLAFKNHMVYAFLAGAELNNVKACLEHGDFGKWTKENCPKLSNGALHRYMLFAEALAPKLPTVVNLPLLGIGAEIPEPVHKEVSEAVYKITDGKTLTQMYRDLGVIRDKEHQKHTPPKKLTPDEEARAKRDQADAVIDNAISALRHIIESEAMFNEHLSKGKAKELLMECRAFSRAMTKKKGAK